MTGLRLSGLGIRHDGETLLRDISFDIRPGETLCLIGASGGGKSLIASAITGLLPDCMTATGQIRLGPETRQAADAPGLRALWSRHACLLPQEPAAALAPLLRALDQLRLTGQTAPEARTFLARFGLDRRATKRFPVELSGGMAQRLLSALVARTNAGVLIIDEPTKGLDPARRADTVAMLTGLRDAGRTLLIITHDLEVVRSLGGHLAVLEHGAITETGPAETLLATPSSAFLRACRDADPASWPVTRRPASGTAVAESDALVIARQRRRLAGPLTLDLRQAQITALLGASGIGKTTLGDTLLGLERAAAGTVSWFGRKLDRQSRHHHRQRFQKLHQDPATVFPSTRTFGESLADLRHLPHGRDLSTRANTLLEQLGISPDLLARRPGEVSGGEAQRLALARLLTVQPALLVADEPSSRLDPPTQAEALKLLRHHVETTDLSVLLITHDPAIATALADTKIELGDYALTSPDTPAS